MKFALIGATAVVAAAFATPALAQAIIEGPCYRAQFHLNANCQNLGPGNRYSNDGHYRVDPDMETAEPNAHRYHGGPKSND